MTSGDLDAAEPLIEALLHQQDSAGLHGLLGNVEASRKDFKAAAVQYQIAAKMDPSEDNIFTFGTSLMKVNFDAATSVLRYGLQKYPLSIKIHVALALALYAQDQADEGARLLCQASHLAPSDVHPMEVLSDTGVVPSGVRKDVEKHLEHLHRIFPKNGQILFDYAMATSGRWSGDKTDTSPALIEKLKTALAIDPRLVKADSELGAIYDETKDYANEIVVLKKAIALKPDDEHYHFRLAFAYRQAGDAMQFEKELSLYQTLHATEVIQR